MLEAVQDKRTTSDSKCIQDDASAAPTADALEPVRSDPHADPTTVAEQRVPEPARPGPEQRVQAGALGRLLLKISAKPIEILQALDDLSERISDRVLREIRAFRRESEARHDVQDARIGTLGKLYEGLCRELNGLRKEFDGLRKEVDGLRKELDGLRKELDGMRSQIRLLVALIALLLVFLGALITVGLMNWFSLESATASPPALEMQEPTARAEESASASESPPLASTPAGTDEARPEVDGAEESGAPLPPDP